MEWYRDKIFPFDNETVDFVRYKIYATLVVEFLKLLLVALLFPKIAYTVEKNIYGVQIIHYFASNRLFKAASSEPFCKLHCCRRKI